MAVSTNHKMHTRVSHNNCQECRADRERQFLRPQWPGYEFVTAYLSWCKPRLEAIKAGDDTNYAAIWHRNFLLALHRRITLKGSAEVGRKYNDSYLERLNQFPRSTDGAYLRQFARRGASTLN